MLRGVASVIQFDDAKGLSRRCIGQNEINAHLADPGPGPAVAIYGLENGA